MPMPKSLLCSVIRKPLSMTKEKLDQCTSLVFASNVMTSCSLVIFTVKDPKDQGLNLFLDIHTCLWTFTWLTVSQVYVSWRQGSSESLWWMKFEEGCRPVTEELYLPTKHWQEDNKDGKVKKGCGWEKGLSSAFHIPNVCQKQFTAHMFSRFWNLYL